MWVLYALASAAVAATFVTITKAGLKSADPSVSLGVQATCAVVVAWAAVFIRGKAGTLAELSGKDWGLLLLSGTLTGVSSLLLFMALKDGPSSRVIPVDRLSFVLAAVLALFFLGEKINLQTGVGLGLMTVGAVVIALVKEEGGGGEGK